VPFSAWLPSAMLAPTPVSALVHSSTLVTAGVYLLYRFAHLHAPNLINVGMFTTLLAGLAALMERDIKKIVALSTLSQLGLIVTSLGFGHRALCFAHLNVHASFKALLFLTVGTVIHSTYSSQEARALGGLLYSCPRIVVPVILACASMCGFIFLSGSVTKEAILEASLNRGIGVGVVVLFYLGIALTLAYSLLLIHAMAGNGTTSCVLLTRFTLRPLSRLPLLCLSVSSVTIGSALFFNCWHFPSILSWLDAILVFWVCGVASFVSRLVPRTVFRVSFPHLYLFTCTSYLRYVAKPGSKLLFTEMGCIHGFGLSGTTSLVLGTRSGWVITSKALVVLGSVLLLA